MPSTTYPWVDAVRAAVDANPHAVHRKRMCGYEFRPGDMAWNCRQCQKDETCVLCHACFSASHANLPHHDVTFYYTQQGTGCCDCGDDEAWDPDGFCAEHNPPTADGADMDILTSVPPELLATAQADVVRDVNVLLRYVLGRQRGFQRALTPEDSGLFDLWLHVTESAAARSAPEKLTLVQGSMSADSVSHWLSTLDRSNVSIFDSGDPAVYADVLAVFSRITQCALASDVLCRLVAHEMSSVHSTELLGELIRTEALLPQAESAALHTLIMALLPDPAFKEAFAIAFTHSYRAVFAKYLQGHGTPGQTILVLGVQFLNRASFVHKLVADHQLLDELLGAFASLVVGGEKSSAADLCIFQGFRSKEEYGDDNIHPWDQMALRMLRTDVIHEMDDVALATTRRPPFMVDTPPFTSHRYNQVLVDLKYVFQIPHDRFVSRFGRHLRWLGQLLSHLQGMGATCRIPPAHNHVAVDSRSWIVYIELATLVQEMMSALILNVVTFDTSDSQSAITALVGPVLESLCLWLATTHSYFPPDQLDRPVGDPDVAVGVHFPLHHTFVLILRAATCAPALMDAFQAAVNATLPHPASCDRVGRWHRLMLVRPLLRALVWDAQVHVNMWRRNGFGVINHSLNYGEPFYCFKLRDLDLLGVQYAVATTGMDTIVPLILEEFDISTLHVPEFEDSMLAECFKVLCQIATELPLGTSSLDSRLRRLLVLRLCCKPSTHSELFKCVTEFCAVHEVQTALSSLSLDAAVKTLTKDYILPNQKVYTLDPRHLELYDATTIHLTRKQHEAARLNRLEHRVDTFKKDPMPSTYLPAVPPPLHVTEGDALPQFEEAYYMLLHPSICAKLAGVLRQLDEATTSLATMAIHLLTLQLYALRTALDHRVYAALAKSYLTWLASVLPSLDTLNPWASTTQVRSQADHERGRHIEWILHQVSAYPGFHMYARFPSDDVVASPPPPPLSARHVPQQLALVRMEQQRAQFLASLATDLDDDEEEEEDVTMAWEPCAMCHLADNEATLCFIGFVHLSGLNVPPVDAIKKTPWEDMRKEVPLTMQCCGHCVHRGCWDSYFATQFQKVITGEAYLNAVDVKKGEFLCPQCKSISNVLVPVSLGQGNSSSVDVSADVDWATWLQPPSTSAHDPPAQAPLDEGLAKLCMSIHRVATGAIEKAHPRRYIATACHAVFTSMWTAAITDMPLDKIRPLAAAAAHLRHPELSVREMLATGEASNSKVDALVDTHTLTQVQRTWHSVVGAKPLLLHDLGSIAARGALLSENAMDAVRSVQLVALAFVVQSTLWLLSSALPPLDDVDEDATSWFLGEWCDGASKDVGVAVLRGLVQASDLSMVSDQHSLLDRVAVECRPFCDQAWAMLSTVTSSPASSWLSLPRLPDALVKVVHTWVHTFETTYDTMADPQGVLAQWRLKQNCGPSWKSVLQQDLNAAHVPLSTLWYRQRTHFMRHLPTAFNALYLDLTKQVCPACRLFPARPAVCLICGGVLCAASSCKSISPMSVSGACTLHAHKCGRGVGMFLLVLEGKVLLVSGKLAAYYGPSLYVDAHGEGFGESHSTVTFRGRPLFLQSHTRDALLRLWATQGIPLAIVQAQNMATHVVPNSHY